MAQSPQDHPHDQDRVSLDQTQEPAFWMIELNVFKEQLEAAVAGLEPTPGPFGTVLSV